MLVKIEVNDKVIKARKGETIMTALESNGIRIPSLCAMKDFTPTGACRMCVVEVEGKTGLVPSCSQPVAEWMKIKTHSPRVIKSRKTIVELLLSNHPDDCLYCERNGNCELQTLAEELNVRERRIMGRKNKYKLDHSSPSIVRDPAKCILCGRCVRVCDEKLSVWAIDFVNRGNRTIVGTACNKDLNFSSCINCGQCIMVCPTGALLEKDSLAELEDALHNEQKTVIVQYDSSVSASLGEAFGMKPGKDIGPTINGALKKIGFDKVFATSFAADLHTVELARELAERKKTREAVPLISGTCPSWVKFAEQSCPDLLHAISPCKSPQQMMGVLLKSLYPQSAGLKPENIFAVAITSCTARKFEAQREEMTRKGLSDIDAVLTTRELAKLIKLYGVDMNQVEPEQADDPYGTGSSSGKLYGAAGGMTEALIRVLPGIMDGRETDIPRMPEMRSSREKKEAEIRIGKKTFRLAAISGLTNALQLIDEIRAGNCNYDFVEIMVCPGGCINGGGQPIVRDENAPRMRAKALHGIDEKDFLRHPLRNPGLKKLYESFPHEFPGSCKGLLLTTFSPRKVIL
jgi:iron-only hydrogenase group A